MREDLGYRELVDLSGPASLGVLLPLAPVPARAQQQLAYVCRGSLHTSRQDRISRHHLGHGLLIRENYARHSTAMVRPIWRRGRVHRGREFNDVRRPMK